MDDYCRVRQAAAKVEAARARAAEAGHKAAERERARKGPGPVRTITDPDSRLMPVRGGFIQGYNAQNMTSTDGLVIATELTDDPVDCGWFEPMLARARDAAALIAAHRPAASPGQEPGGQDGGGIRAGHPGDEKAAENRRGDHRLPPARPHCRDPHGNIKHNLGFRQLPMRGNPKASAEWTFTCAVHNLLKAISAGRLTSQAVAALAG